MKLNNYLKLIVSILVYLIISLPIIFAQELNLQYDAVGNLVTGDNFYREYDGFNHLIRIRQANTSSGNITEELIWHPIEERVFIKKVYWNNQSLRSTIKYLNKNSIKVRNESGTFYENYIYQDDILVAQRDANGNKQAIHNDHIGSVSLITDSSGAVIENSFFSPFGEQITPVMDSRYSFTGKEFDSVTGHYDFMSRMTKPEWANRFTQVDRIFYDFTRYEEKRLVAYYDPQLLNPYAYARNNPYLFVDKVGEFIFKNFVEGTVSAVGGALLIAAALTTAPATAAVLAVVGAAALAFGISKAILGAITPKSEESSIAYASEVFSSPLGPVGEVHNQLIGKEEAEEEKIERLKKYNLGYDVATLFKKPEGILDWGLWGYNYVDVWIRIYKGTSSGGGGGSKSTVRQTPDGRWVCDTCDDKGYEIPPHKRPPPNPPPT